MISILLCITLGILLPIILLGISLSTMDKNEKYVYYAILAVIALVIKFIWGGQSKGINVALIIVVAGVGFACYKAQDRVLEVLGKVKDIFVKYMEAINKMNLGTNNLEEDISYSINMKGILNLSFKIEIAILLLSAIGFIKEVSGLALTLGVTLYIAVMHGFILKDEVLLASIESIRRSIKVRLKLLDDASTYEEEVRDNEEVGNYVEQQKTDEKGKKSTQQKSSVSRVNRYEDDEDEEESYNTRAARNRRPPARNISDEQPRSRRAPSLTERRIPSYLEEDDDDDRIDRERLRDRRSSYLRDAPSGRDRSSMRNSDLRLGYEDIDKDDRMSSRTALSRNRVDGRDSFKNMRQSINRSRQEQEPIRPRRRRLDDEGNEL